MKALQITEPGKSQIAEVPEPSAPSEGEVKLRIERVGYCGSDLSTYRGLNPLVSYPRIPGHEVCGTIEAVGEGVPAEWAVGLRVLALPYTSCGDCAACRAGRPNACQKNQTLGVQREGAMTEWINLPFEKLLTSSKLNSAEMALVEPLTVGFHAVDRGAVTAEDTVAVYGCGAIGLGVIAGAAVRGARVVAIDLDPAKLNLAKACGAKETINAGEQDGHAVLQKLTNGDGPEVMVEAVGSPATFRACVEEVAFAGRVVYIGYAKAPVEYETKYFVMKELDIRGSRNALRKDFEAVIELLERGEFPVDLVITKTVSLEEAPAALAAWAENPGAVTKIQVAF